jgi:hypothetical protein
LQTLPFMNMDQGHILWEQWHANCFLAIGFVSLVVKQSPTPGSIIRRVLVVSKAATWKVTALAIHCFATAVALADSAHGFSSPTSVFSPASTPAQSIYGLSLFRTCAAAAVFVVVFGLLAYAVIKFRERAHDDKRQPTQVYCSSQVETAWTVIPVLIVLVLFLATAQVIANVQDAAKPHDAIEVTVIGHQYWWAYRYPGLNVVTGGPCGTGREGARASDRNQSVLPRRRLRSLQSFAGVRPSARA